MKAVQARTRIALKNILFATDFSQAAAAAAPFAVQIACSYGAKVYGVHVNPLQQLLPQDADLWCEPGYFVEQGIASEKILEAAEKQHADLIVLGAQPANWLATHRNAGTVYKVVTQAKCPVLTVRN